MSRSRAALLISLLLGSCFEQVPLFGRSGPCAPATDDLHGCWPHEHDVAATIGGWCVVNGTDIECQHQVFADPDPMAMDFMVSSPSFTAPTGSGWSAIALGPRPWQSPSHGTGDRLFAIRDDGELVVAGDGAGAQLGIPGTTHTSTLMHVSDGPYRSVCAGIDTACAVTRDGALECWGEGATRGLPAPLHGTVGAPTPVDGHHDWASVSCWDRLTCGLRGPGAVHCWGVYTPEGHVSDSTVSYDIASAIDLPPAVTVSAGRQHACAITVDGTYCWGRARFLGAGEIASDQASPRRVDVVPLSRLSAGMTFTCGIAAAGEPRVWCWGENGSGQTGDPHVSLLPGPTPNPLAGAPIDLAAGTLFTVLRTTNPMPDLIGDLRSTNGGH